MREVVIVDSVRTGLAKSFRGKFNQTRPDDMAAHCVNALLARNGIDNRRVHLGTDITCLHKASPSCIYAL